MPVPNFVLGESCAYSREDGTPAGALEESVGGLEDGFSVSFAFAMAEIAALSINSLLARSWHCRTIATLVLRVWRKLANAANGGPHFASPRPTQRAGSNCAVLPIWFGWNRVQTGCG
jgi:hypothetical protein